jgi:hypothetical protein
MGEGIGETGSDRRTEVPDSYGGLPRTIKLPAQPRHKVADSEGMSKP